MATRAQGVVVELPIVVEELVAVVVLVVLLVELSGLVVVVLEVVVLVVVVELVVVPTKSPPIEVFESEPCWPTTVDSERPIASSMKVTQPREMAKTRATAAKIDHLRPAG
jgi:ABC-type multidrug transport system fused ATPase/permease subunit